VLTAEHNTSMLWGTYRPHKYFGVKSRTAPVSLQTGEGSTMGISFMVVAYRGRCSEVNLQTLLSTPDDGDQRFRLTSWLWQGCYGMGPESRWSRRGMTAGRMMGSNREKHGVSLARAGRRR
jgi:hypothetical protein